MFCILTESEKKSLPDLFGMMCMAWLVGLLCKVFIVFIYFLHSLNPLQGRDQLDVEIVIVTKNLTKF
jgi:hypothetical protein